MCSRKTQISFNPTFFMIKIMCLCLKADFIPAEVQVSFKCNAQVFAYSLLRLHGQVICFRTKPSRLQAEIAANTDANRAFISNSISVCAQRASPLAHIPYREAKGCKKAHLFPLWVLHPPFGAQHVVFIHTHTHTHVLALQLWAKPRSVPAQQQKPKPNSQLFPPKAWV